MHQSLRMSWIKCYHRLGLAERLHHLLSFLPKRFWWPVSQQGANFVVKDLSSDSVAKWVKKKTMLILFNSLKNILLSNKKSNSIYLDKLSELLRGLTISTVSIQYRSVVETHRLAYRFLQQKKKRFSKRICFEESEKLCDHSLPSQTQANALKLFMLSRKRSSEDCRWR